MPTRSAATIAALAALTLTLAPSASASDTQPLLAATFGSRSGQLVRVDPTTLAPIGAPLAELSLTWSALRSDDGTLIALTSAATPLRIVDVSDGRVISQVAAGRITLAPGAWSRPDRVLSVTPWKHSSLVVLDPTSHRVLIRTRLGGTIGAGVASRGSLVLLVEPPGRVGRTRLVVVNPRGGIRSVALPGIEGGTQVPLGTVTTDVRVRDESPGLAVDPAGERAAIVDGDGRVAIVELASMRVALHHVTLRRQASSRKQLSGWWRQAAWLTPGVLAVSGSDYGDTGRAAAAHAAGLTLIRTRDWSSRLVDPGASRLAVAGRTALVTGDGASGGLRGLGPDGAPRFHLLGRQQLGEIAVMRARVYITGCNGWCFHVVDPRAGRVLLSPVLHQQTSLLG